MEKDFKDSDDTDCKTKNGFFMNALNHGLYDAHYTNKSEKKRRG